MAREAAPFPIVGIGASAGGLEALEALTKRLSTDRMSFVVLQHLAPGHESALTDILARGNAMKVVTVQDGMRLDPGRIHVAPPNVDVLVHQGVLRLMAPNPERRGPRLSIDAFFRSLASDQGATAIGVILSGAGTDGTLGLKAIKEEGGITFVQEPSTAGQSSMPQSALDAGCADFCLSPAEIGDELMRLSQHPYVVPAHPPRVFDEDNRSKLFLLLRTAFGVDFAAYKQSTIERRIQRRMALHKLDRLEDYLKYVQATGGELNVLYSDLLIAVTRFFRDEEPFEALKSLVFPRLLENRNRELPIRIWVPGCATGEEAFSIAINLLEYLEERASNYKIQIFATDIEEQSLARARLAVYPQNIEVDVAPERLQRFFTRSEKGYQVRRAVRDLVVFARHNVGKDPPFSRIDLVSCRNVLIYMQPSLQKRVLRIFHYALNPNAFLLLGTSESVGDGSELFSLADRKTKIYSKKEAATTAAFDLSFASRPEPEAPSARLADYRPGISVLQLADRKVLEQYGPPGVVVNEVFDILQYRGKTGRFFEPSPGIATINLLKLARPELLPELRASLRKALVDNVRVISSPVHPWHDNESVTVRLDVTPLPDPGAAGKTFLVLFNEQGGESQAVDTAPSESAPIDTRIQELERELASTKEYLKTTSENSEAANEELQSANEELQSANEELQSTNEELETSKEELQSTNEELVTLNEELQNRMAQLNVTSDDLLNVFGATTSALVLVGMDLRIRAFSLAAEKLLNLIPGDVGRPIAYLRAVVKARDLEETVSRAINALAATEQRVRSADGDWYTMRITPYRTADHVIRGAVLELVRAVAGEKEEEPRELRGLGQAILAAVPLGLALLDDKLRITWANESFLGLFHVSADVFGRPLEDLWGGKTEQPGLWRMLEDAAIEGRPFQSAVTLKPFGEPLERSVRFSARRLPRIGEQSALTLIVVEGGSEREGSDGL
jgi:two-component system CheB/CheR fusion protein